MKTFFKKIIKLIDIYEENKSLRKWIDSGWQKGVPIVNSTVLIKHELGAGENFDVVCYLGKDNKGADRFMTNNGIEIYKKHVLRYRYIY